MKIIACGPEEVIVSMSVKELERMSDVKIGDFYGNGGLSYSKAAGKEIDINKFCDALYNLKLAHETKDKVIDNLKTIIKRIDDAYFPIADFNDFKAERVK